jgi:hypothetical protein
MVSILEMKNKIYALLSQRNLDVNKFNVDILYQAGIKNIVNNIEFYYDKPYTCESVFKELFNIGVIEEINKVQSF